MGKKTGFLEFLKALGEEDDSKTTIIILVITIVNIVLTFLKALLSYIDGSMSIASSALESFGDVFSCIVIGYNRYKEQTANPIKYPRGRNARSQGYNICAFIMIVVALGCLVIDLDRFFIQQIIPKLNYYDLGMMCFNVLCKAILWIVCYNSKSSELVVLKMDQQNDIINNLVTMICLTAGLFLSIWFDLIGAFVICGCIVRNWVKILFKHNKRVHGRVVGEDIQKNLIKHAEEILKVAETKELIAYYNGYPITIEAYIECFDVDFHEAADMIRDHMKTFENVQTVHVFPFDPRKRATDVEEDVGNFKEITEIGLRTPLLKKHIIDNEVDVTNTGSTPTIVIGDSQNDQATAVLEDSDTAKDTA